MLALRGDIEIRRGDYLSARASFAEALSTREQIFGASHPLVADSQARLAAADLALGSQDAALTRALDAERTGRDHLQFTVRYLPERQAMAYAAKRPRALDLALSIVASESAAAPKSVFNAVIQSRGVILDELVAREKARSGSGPETASLNATATQARQRYANLIVRSLQEQVPRAMLDEARQQKEDAERALAESSVDARTEMRRADISFNDVDEALPDEACTRLFWRCTTEPESLSRHTSPFCSKPIPSCTEAPCNEREPPRLRSCRLARLRGLMGLSKPGASKLGWLDRQWSLCLSSWYRVSDCRRRASPGCVASASTATSLERRAPSSSPTVFSTSSTSLRCQIETAATWLRGHQPFTTFQPNEISSCRPINHRGAGSSQWEGPRLVKAQRRLRRSLRPFAQAATASATSTLKICLARGVR